MSARAWKRIRAESKAWPERPAGRSARPSSALSDAIFGDRDIFSLIAERAGQDWSVQNAEQWTPYPEQNDHARGLALPCPGQGYSEEYCELWRRNLRLGARQALHTINAIQKVNRVGQFVGLIEEGRILADVYRRTKMSRLEMALALSHHMALTIAGDANSVKRYYDPSDHIEELIYDRTFRTSQCDVSDGVDLQEVLNNIFGNLEAELGPAATRHLAVREFSDYIFSRHVPQTARELDAALAGKCLICASQSGTLCACRLCNGRAPNTSKPMVAVESEFEDPVRSSRTTAQFNMPWCGEYKIKRMPNAIPGFMTVPYIHKTSVDLPFTSAHHLVTLNVRTLKDVRRAIDDPPDEPFGPRSLEGGFGNPSCTVRMQRVHENTSQTQRTAAENDAFCLISHAMRSVGTFGTLSRKLRALSAMHLWHAQIEYDAVRESLDQGFGVAPLESHKAQFAISLPVLTYPSIEGLVPQARFTRESAPCSIAELLGMTNAQATAAIREERARESKLAHDRSKVWEARRVRLLEAVVGALRRDSALGPFWRNAPVGALDRDRTTYYEANARDVEAPPDPGVPPVRVYGLAFWCPNTHLIATWRMQHHGKRRCVGRALLARVKPGKTPTATLQALLNCLDNDYGFRERLLASALYHFRALHTVLRPVQRPLSTCRSAAYHNLQSISMVLTRLWTAQRSTYKASALVAKSPTSGEWDLQSLKLNNPHLVLGMWVGAMMRKSTTIEIEATHVFERIHPMQVSASSFGPFKPKAASYEYDSNGALGVALTLTAYTGHDRILDADNLRLHCSIALPDLPMALGWFSGHEPSGFMNIVRRMHWHDSTTDFPNPPTHRNGNTHVDQKALPFVGPATRREWLQRAKRLCDITNQTFVHNDRDFTGTINATLRRLIVLNKLLLRTWIQTPTKGPSLDRLVDEFHIEEVSAQKIQDLLDDPVDVYPAIKGQLQKGLWNSKLYNPGATKNGFQVLKSRTRIRPDSAQQVYQPFESTPVSFCKTQGFKAYCRCTANCLVTDRVFGEESASLRQQTLQFGPFERGRRTFSHTS